MPRFVVLEHRWKGTHWDFMLESGGVLRTWALQASPESDGPILAKPLADHRLRYLDYEGPIDGDRGSVVAWDRGTYEVLAEKPLKLVLRLAGSRLGGKVELIGERGRENWTYRPLEP